jgi:hypothetical protein
MSKLTLKRCAMGSGLAAVGIPVAWVAIGTVLQAFDSNAALGLGWFTVLPMILSVPTCVGFAIVFALLAAVTPDKQ